MSAVVERQNSVIRHRDRFSGPIRFGLAATALLLGLGCSSLRTREQPQSNEFLVRNTTQCFARVYADPRTTWAGMTELANLEPGQHIVVDLPLGTRVYTATHMNGAGTHMRTGSDAKNEDLCRRSGKVRVTRVPATT